MVKKAGSCALGSGTQGSTRVSEGLQVDHGTADVLPHPALHATILSVDH